MLFNAQHNVGKSFKKKLLLSQWTIFVDFNLSHPVWGRLCRQLTTIELNLNFALWSFSTPAYDYAPNPDKQWILQVTDRMEPIHKKFTDILMTKRLQTLQSIDEGIERVIENFNCQKKLAQKINQKLKKQNFPKMFHISGSNFSPYFIKF